MILVRRSAIQLVSAVGVLAAVAVLDLGPRATAAYHHPIAGQSVSAPVRLGQEGPDATTDPAPDRPAKKYSDPHSLPTGWSQHTPMGGTTPPTGNGGAGDHPSSGLIPAATPPAATLVYYLRESAASFDLSKLIDPLLDPPRSC